MQCGCSIKAQITEYFDFRNRKWKNYNIHLRWKIGMWSILKVPEIFQHRWSPGKIQSPSRKVVLWWLQEIWQDFRPKILENHFIEAIMFMKMTHTAMKVQCNVKLDLRPGMLLKCITNTIEKLYEKADWTFNKPCHICKEKASQLPLSQVVILHAKVISHCMVLNRRWNLIMIFLICFVVTYDGKSGFNFYSFFFILGRRVCPNRIDSFHDVKTLWKYF